MDPQKIVALAVFSGVPLLAGIAYWMYTQENTIAAYALGAAALADVVVGLVLLKKTQ